MLTRLQSEEHSVELEAQKLRSQISDMKKQGDSEIKKLTSQLKLLEEEEHGAKDEAEKAKLKVEKLNKHIEDLETTARSENDELEQLRAVVDKDKDEIQKLKDCIVSLRGEVAAFKTKHTDLHKKDLDAQMNLPGQIQKMKQAEDISGRGRILVDYGNHQLKICIPILFVPVLHDHEIITRFADEITSKEVLQDVADFMAIFKGSRIMVEGHTRTPDDLLDNWAFKLANARADFIKKTISDHGIGQEQIDTSGLPGKHGIGKPAIKLRMLSYTEDHDAG